MKISTMVTGFTAFSLLASTSMIGKTNACTICALEQYYVFSAIFSGPLFQSIGNVFFNTYHALQGNFIFSFTNESIFDRLHIPEISTELQKCDGALGKQVREGRFELKKVLKFTDPDDCVEYSMPLRIFFNQNIRLGTKEKLQFGAYATEDWRKVIGFHIDQPTITEEDIKNLEELRKFYQFPITQIFAWQVQRPELRQSKTIFMWRLKNFSITTSFTVPEECSNVPVFQIKPDKWGEQLTVRTAAFNAELHRKLIWRSNLFEHPAYGIIPRTQEFIIDKAFALKKFIIDLFCSVEEIFSRYDKDESRIKDCAEFADHPQLQDTWCAWIDNAMQNMGRGLMNNRLLEWRWSKRHQEFPASQPQTKVENTQANSFFDTVYEKVGQFSEWFFGDDWVDARGL